MATTRLGPSTGLHRAALQEHARITADRERISERIAQLRTELASLEHVERDLADQAHLLDQVIARDHRVLADSEVVLRGASLREQALQVLVTHVGIREPISYRDWYRLVRQAGFVVLGKRPLAAFLTTVTRSPMLKRGAEPGNYYVEPAAIDGLRQDLAEHQAELRHLEAHLATRPPGASPLHRHRLNLMATIRRLERQVAEAERILKIHRDTVFKAAQRAA